jgi:hypothetical protein
MKITPLFAWTIWQAARFALEQPARLSIAKRYPGGGQEVPIHCAETGISNPPRDAVE